MNPHVCACVSFTVQLSVQRSVITNPINVSVSASHVRVIYTEAGSASLQPGTQRQETTQHTPTHPHIYQRACTRHVVTLDIYMHPMCPSRTHTHMHIAACSTHHQPQPPQHSVCPSSIHVSVMQGGSQGHTYRHPIDTHTAPCGTQQNCRERLCAANTTAMMHAGCGQQAHKHSHALINQ